jgi:uncharacterized protein
MITSWVFIGVSVGTLLGLTGAGGAIIAVPLFIHLTEASVREATTLSLIAVTFGALFNGWLQRKHAVFRAALPLFAFSTLGSAALRPLKAHSPEWVIALVFISVGALSLYSIWRDKPAVESKEVKNPIRFWTSVVLGGFGFGGLVTMTGLGGGVILVPLLKRLFNMPFAETTATSLVLIILASISSLAFQWQGVSELLSPPALLALGLGSILSAIVTKAAIKKLEPRVVDQIRKIALTGVILFAIITVAQRA